MERQFSCMHEKGDLHHGWDECILCSKYRVCRPEPTQAQSYAQHARRRSEKQGVADDYVFSMNIFALHLTEQNSSLLMSC